MYRLFVETEPDVELGRYHDKHALRLAVGDLARIYNTADGFLIVRPINPSRTMRAEKVKEGYSPSFYVC